MKKISACTIILASTCIAFSAVSCETTEVPVPGKERVVRENVTIEYYNLADGYLELKKYDNAIKYYKLAMQNKDLYASAYYKLGKSYAFSKDWGNALTVFSDLLKKDPENTSLSLAVAYVTAMNGDTDSALVQYKNLMEKSPDNVDIIKNYIKVLIAQGRYELAEQKLIILEEKFPDDKDIETLKKKIADGLGERVSDDAESAKPETKSNSAPEPSESGGKEEPVPPNLDAVPPDTAE